MQFHRCDDLLAGHAGAVEDDRIGGGHHRRDAAGGVLGVAHVLGGEHLLERHVLAAQAQFAVATAGSFLVIGDEKELALGVWEDDRALVASLGDEVASLGDLRCQTSSRRRTTGLSAVAPVNAVICG